MFQLHARDNDGDDFTSSAGTWEDTVLVTDSKILS